MSTSWEKAAARLGLVHKAGEYWGQIWGTIRGRPIYIQPDFLSTVGSEWETKRSYFQSALEGSVVSEPEMAIGVLMSLSPELDLGWKELHQLFEWGDLSALTGRAADLVDVHVQEALVSLKPWARSIEMSDFQLKLTTRSELLPEDQLVELIEAAMALPEAIDRARQGVPVRPENMVYADMFQTIARDHTLSFLPCPLGVAGFLQGMGVLLFVRPAIKGALFESSSPRMLRLRIMSGLASEALDAVVTSLLSSHRGSKTIIHGEGDQLTIDEPAIESAPQLLLDALLALAAARPRPQGSPFR